MRPSAALQAKRDDVRQAVMRFRAANPRVFGSARHGADRDGSDLDLLADLGDVPGDLLDGAANRMAIAAAVGRVLTAGGPCRRCPAATTACRSRCRRPMAAMTA